MTRREFIERVAAAAAVTTVTGALGAAPADPPAAGQLPTRPYGKHGVKLSVIGFGGIVVMNMEQKDANDHVARAVERGVNYFDVAPTYGNAQERLGPALEPFRKRCFLACKTTQRTAEDAKRELDASLQAMRTDWFDLYQLHALTKMKEDVDVVFGKGGAMEAFIQAKKEGRIRHLGFSAHSVDAALAAMDRYDFDSILFPVNFATFYGADFGPQVVDRAVAKGVSILALKTLARQKWPSKDDPLRKTYRKCWYQPITDPAEQELAVRFTLSQPISAALPPGEAPLFWRAVELAEHFVPLAAAEADTLRRLAPSLAPIFS